jgi:sacsin
VSGDSVVTFDPHVNFLPGATASQPGIKIKFTSDTKETGAAAGGASGGIKPSNNNSNKSARLREHFPDQFNPLCFFGNDLNRYFDGTLFRFPLRTKSLAQQSEISKAYYGKVLHYKHMCICTYANS